MAVTKHFGWYILLVATVLLGAASAIYFTANTEPIEGAAGLPHQFGEFQLTSAISGREALESVESLHVGSPGDIDEAIIAVYMDSSSRRVHLWVAGFADEEVAGVSLDRMVDAMQRQPQFGYQPERHSVDGIDVYVSHGDKKVDVFWSDGTRLIYILISPASMDDALDITREFMEQYRQAV